MKTKNDLMLPNELLELVKPGQDLGPEAEVWSKMTEDTHKSRFAGWVNKVAMMLVDQRMVEVMMIKGDAGPYDVLDTSDEALGVLQYVGNYDKWKDVVHHEGDLTQDSRVVVNRGGKFSKTKGRKRFVSGISEEGQDLYEHALRFFEALREMPMFDIIVQECKRNWINSVAYKSAKQRIGNEGKKSLKPSDADDEMLCDDDVGGVDDRFVKSFYGEDGPSDHDENEWFGDEEEGEDEDKDCDEEDSDSDDE